MVRRPADTLGMMSTRLRPALPALLLEMLPVWCYAGIGAAIALMLLAEPLGISDAAYVPLALAAICFGVGTFAGGIGWLMLGEQRIGAIVLGTRVFAVIALLYLAGQGFEAATHCSGDCGYAGEALAAPLLLLFFAGPLISSGFLLARVLSAPLPSAGRV
jgi:hypothetical protein